MGGPWWAPSATGAPNTLRGVQDGMEVSDDSSTVLPTGGHERHLSPAPVGTAQALVHIPRCVFPPGSSRQGSRVAAWMRKARHAGSCRARRGPRGTTWPRGRRRRWPLLGLQRHLPRRCSAHGSRVHHCVHCVAAHGGGALRSRAASAGSARRPGLGPAAPPLWTPIWPSPQPQLRDAEWDGPVRANALLLLAGEELGEQSGPLLSRGARGSVRSVGSWN